LENKEHTWKDWINQDTKFLRDPGNCSLFTLKDHPEFPNLSLLPEEEVIEVLSEFVRSEGKVVNLEMLLQYAPIFELALQKQNLPSIFG